MLSAQYVTVEDGAAFVASFYVDIAGKSRTKPVQLFTGNATIDVAAYPVAPGTEIWPVVSALPGSHVGGSPVAFAANGLTALYEIKGTTLHFTLTFLGVRNPAPVGTPAED
jgi:hypothetical protein